MVRCAGWRNQASGDSVQCSEGHVHGTYWDPSHVAGCALSYAKVEYATPATGGAATSAMTFSRSAFRAGENRQGGVRGTAQILNA